MYKRTAERILGIIGLVIAGITAIVGGFSMAATQMPEVEAELVKQNIEVEDVDLILEAMFFSGLVLLIVAGITTILAFVAVLLLKKDKKGTAAGVVFIISGAVISIGSFPYGLFAGIPLIIAGIIAIIKKPLPEESPGY